MSRSIDGGSKTQPPIQTRPYDFGTDAIERQRVSLGQALIDADFEYGLQATKWQTSQEIRKWPSFYEIAGTDISISSVTVSAYAANVPATVTVNIVGALPVQLIVGSVVSIFGLSNPQRNADRAEGYFLVQSVASSSFTYVAKGAIGNSTTVTYPQTISTSYTTLRRGGVYTNGTSRLGFSNIAFDGKSIVTVSFPAPHGLVAGTPIQTSLQGFSNLNGTWTITSVPTPNTFIFSNLNSIVGSASSSPTVQIVTGTVLAATSTNVATCTITSNIGALQAGAQIPISSIPGVSPGYGTAVISNISGSSTLTANIVFSVPQTLTAGSFINLPMLVTSNVNAVGVSGTAASSGGAGAITFSNLNVVQGGLALGQTVPGSTFGGAGTGTVATIQNSPFLITITGATSIPVSTANVISNATFTGNAGVNNVIYTSPYSYAQHRPLDGGVLISPNNPVYGGSMTRQSKKVFRYQSGKGILFSTGTLFCPINDVTFVTAASPATSGSIRITCDVPHGGPQPGATINLRGISSPGYNGSYTVSNIVDSKTLEVIPPGGVSSLVSPAVFQDQPRYCMSSWQGSSVRAGVFDDQNGMFWEYDGQNLWNVRRSSTFQLAGYVTIQPGSQTMLGDTSDTSIYLNSNVLLGTNVFAATGVTGTFGAVTNSLSIPVTYTADSNVNAGQLIPISVFGGLASFTVSGSYASFASGATTAAITAATTTGVLTVGTPFSILSGYPGTITTISSYPNSFTFTFTTAPSVPTLSSLVTNQTIITVTCTAHKLLTGTSVTLTGSTPSGFNQTGVITVTSPTTFTFPNPSSISIPASVNGVSGATLVANGTSATVTTAAPHGLTGVLGIVISGAPGFNGNQLATVQDAKTLTFPTSSLVTASVVGTMSTFTVPAGTFSASATYPAGSRNTVTCSWAAITNSTSLTLSGATLTVGAFAAVAAFGGYGGYAYANGTSTVTFSQAQTLAAGSSVSIGFDTNPTFTAADACDLGFMTVTNLTSTTFTAVYPIPYTTAGGTFTNQAFSNQWNTNYQIVPFAPDPIPLGTSSLTVVCQSNIYTNSYGPLYPNMQCTSSALQNIFGSAVYVASATANTFVLNFVPLQTTVSKSSIVSLGNQIFTYPNTRFLQQLKVNDRVVLRGMTHSVVQIQTNGVMIVNPPYRGLAAVTVPIKLCKVRETRIHQSQFNRDTFDGKGPSGFLFDPTKMQMTGLQYTWYGAGFIDYMMRGTDGNWVIANRIRNNNVNDEAHMRSGNLPVRYEIVNESLANQTTLAASMGFTDTVLTTADPLTYWPPTGTILIDNELVSYTGISGTYQLIGLVRATTLTYNVNDTSYTLQHSATAQQHNQGSSVTLIGITCTPSLTHWGSSFLIDGGFDFDRGYYFNYQTQGSGSFSAGNTYPLFMLRLAPSVSNGVIGDIGTRDLLNRAQLLLQRMDVFATNSSGTSTGVGIGNVVFSGILNPQGVTAQAWTPINSVINGSAPSFAQVSTVSGQYIAGSGERIFSTICNAGSQNSIDLSTLKEVCNAVIGGNGIFPDGPDTLLVYMFVPTGFPAISEYSTNLFWSEAQA